MKNVKKVLSTILATSVLGSFTVLNANAESFYENEWYINRMSEVTYIGSADDFNDELSELIGTNIWFYEYDELYQYNDINSAFYLNMEAKTNQIDFAIKDEEIFNQIIEEYPVKFDYMHISGGTHTYRDENGGYYTGQAASFCNLLDSEGNIVKEECPEILNDLSQKLYRAGAISRAIYDKYTIYYNYIDLYISEIILELTDNASLNDLNSILDNYQYTYTVVPQNNNTVYIEFGYDENDIVPKTNEEYINFVNELNGYSEVIKKTEYSLIQDSVIRTISSESENIVFSGDANQDNLINISDVVAISANVSKAENNEISLWGSFNGDVHDTGNGLNSSDAFMIQQYVTGVIDSL